MPRVQCQGSMPGVDPRIDARCRWWYAMLLMCYSTLLVDALPGGAAGTHVATQCRYSIPVAAREKDHINTGQERGWKGNSPQVTTKWDWLIHRCTTLFGTGTQFGWTKSSKTASFTISTYPGNIPNVPSPRSYQQLAMSRTYCYALLSPYLSKPCIPPVVGSFVLLWDTSLLCFVKPISFSF